MPKNIVHFLAIFQYILLTLIHAEVVYTNSSLRAVVVSTDDRRYGHTFENLHKSFKDNIQVVRYHPVPFDSTKLDVYYNRLNGLMHIPDILNHRHHKLRKVFSNLWSFYTVISEFAAESPDISAENDWLMIFEDDVAMNPAIKNGFEDVKEAFNYSKNDGILFLGKCVGPSHNFHCIDSAKTSRNIVRSLRTGNVCSCIRGC